jgi:hypothetical protein
LRAPPTAAVTMLTIARAGVRLTNPAIGLSHGKKGSNVG